MAGLAHRWSVHSVPYADLLNGSCASLPKGAGPPRSGASGGKVLGAPPLPDPAPPGQGEACDTLPGGRYRREVLAVRSTAYVECSVDGRTGARARRAIACPCCGDAAETRRDPESVTLTTT
jgi:hypothetical protein